jgi:hypothetical protein
MMVLLNILSKFIRINDDDDDEKNAENKSD